MRRRRLVVHGCDVNHGPAMPQIFHPSFNTISRASIFGALFFVAGIGWMLKVVYRSSYMTQVNVVRPQPVPFSHEHHVAGLGIDCRFCHTTVEEGAFAGIPPTETCMKCHSQIWSDSPMLEPVRSSFRTGEPLAWTRVHDVPDFAFFNHAIHVQKGIGCVTCHGQVDEMPLMWKQNTLHMEWCLECHRAPEKYVRPRDEVFSMHWQPAGEDADFRAKLIEEYHVDPSTDCSTCHR